MPGVPPDALAQIKKGLRGLFGRKKKNQPEATPTTGADSGAATANAPTTASSVPPTTQPESNPPPPQPSATASAGQADATVPPSDPPAPTPSEPQPQPQQSSVPESSRAGEGNPTGSAVTGAASTANNGGTGMSATSGPLNDQIHDYPDAGREKAGTAVPVEGAGVGSVSKPVNIDAVRT